MPRGPRILLSLTYYHVMTRGNNKHVVFPHDEDFEYYRALILKYKNDHPFDLYHYCLMPNHTHFLVKTNKASDFSTFMKRLNLSYFHHYRKYYGWVGYFWQDRYKTQPVGKDEYFIQCGKYIELNPVRAKLVEKPEDYLYSSYRHYAFSISDELLTDDEMFGKLNDNRAKREDIYKQLNISQTALETYQSAIWGSREQRYNELKKLRYNYKK